MQNIRIDDSSDLVPPPDCAVCKRTMRLTSIQWETESRDVYTFHCDACASCQEKSFPLH